MANTLIKIITMAVKICVLKTDGTNCDQETKFAFNLAGGEAEIVLLNTLIKGYDPVSDRKVSLDEYQILAIAGGFSHGDYISAGKILANDLKYFLSEQLDLFVKNAKPIIGICNGFQVLVKYGLLPGLDNQVKQTTTLTNNDSGKFEDRWVKLIKPRSENNSKQDYNDKCIWTKKISQIDFPIAHGEGKFISDSQTIKRIFDEGMVVFQYADGDYNPAIQFPDNPNGSLEAIAGICDPSGLIFGLMPHPERYLFPRNHQLSTLQEVLGRDYVPKDYSSLHSHFKSIEILPKEGKGLQIFRNGVDYVKNYSKH